MRKRRALTATLAAVNLILAGCADPINDSPTTATHAAQQTTTLANNLSDVVNPANGFSLADDGSVTVDGAVNVPADPSQGVTIGDNQNALKVRLPNSTSETDGVADSTGSMTYRSADGTSDTVVPTPQGAQFLKTIKNKTAPAEFSYQIDLPRDGRIILVTSGSDGKNDSRQAALVFNGTGQVIGTIESPWAHDANGKTVQTYFTVSGSTLTQHVLHQQKGVAYPVTADPNIKCYGTGLVITFTYDDMQAIVVGGISAATGLLSVSIPTVLGIIPAGAISAAIANIVAGAAWGVASHQCGWIWLPYPGSWSKPEHGYYPCS